MYGLIHGKSNKGKKVSAMYIYIYIYRGYTSAKKRGNKYMAYIYAYGMYITKLYIVSLRAEPIYFLGDGICTKVGTFSYIENLK
jgi:hypothetical protein